MEVVDSMSKVGACEVHIDVLSATELLVDDFSDPMECIERDCES